mmetsp:Transcript_109367/g.327089  ORF Transcript_109367/g.327089 Transcript_109367/m.327089 type:complete len:242 (-) Transcript_109367:452-1177(-)
MPQASLAKRCTAQSFRSKVLLAGSDQFNWAGQPLSSFQSSLMSSRRRCSRRRSRARARSGRWTARRSPCPALPSGCPPARCAWRPNGSQARSAADAARRPGHSPAVAPRPPRYRRSCRWATAGWRRPRARTAWRARSAACGSSRSAPSPGPPAPSGSPPGRSGPRRSPRRRSARSASWGGRRARPCAGASPPRPPGAPPASGSPPGPQVQGCSSWKCACWSEVLVLRTPPALAGARSPLPS